MYYVLYYALKNVINIKYRDWQSSQGENSTFHNILLHIDVTGLPYRE